MPPPCVDSLLCLASAVLVQEDGLTLHGDHSVLFGVIPERGVHPQLSLSVAYKVMQCCLAPPPLHLL